VEPYFPNPIEAHPMGGKNEPEKPELKKNIIFIASKS
jgi:hypothetical protein